MSFLSQKFVCTIGITKDLVRADPEIIFRVLQQAKYAVQAKGALVKATDFIVGPSIDDPLGQVMEAEFTVITPYRCESCELAVGFYKRENKEVIPMVEFKVTNEGGKK